MIQKCGFGMDLSHWTMHLHLYQLTQCAVDQIHTQISHLICAHVVALTIFALWSQLYYLDSPSQDFNSWIVALKSQE